MYLFFILEPVKIGQPFEKLKLGSNRHKRKRGFHIIQYLIIKEWDNTRTFTPVMLVPTDQLPTTPDVKFQVLLD
jgi:hypothetical protein